MDTTKEFIKMCEKATEIQRTKEPQAGDYWVSGNGDIVILPMAEHIQEFCSYVCLYLVGEEDEVWLPRQDQLQEMVEVPLTVWRAAYLFRTLRDFIMYYQGLEQLSMEQIWLCIVMKEKYNKTWNGEDWN